MLKNSLGALALVVLLTGCGNGDRGLVIGDQSARDADTIEKTVALREGYAQFVDEEKYHASIQYPLDWMVNADDLAAVVHVNKNNEQQLPSFSVFQEPITAGLTANAYAAPSVEKMPSLISGYQLIGTREETIGDLSSFRISYRGTMGASMFMWVQWYVVFENNGYVLTAMMAPDDVATTEPIVDYMASTFRTWR